MKLFGVNKRGERQENILVLNMIFYLHSVLEMLSVFCPEKNCIDEEKKENPTFKCKHTKKKLIWNKMENHCEISVNF